VNYAVNLCDFRTVMDDLPQTAAIAAGAMLKSHVSSGEVVQPVEDRPDEDALLLECEDERAAAICDALRHIGLKHGWGKNKLRIYEQGPRGGWKRIKWARGAPESYTQEGTDDE